MGYSWGTEYRAGTTRPSLVNLSSYSQGQFGVLKRKRNLFLLILLIFNSQYKFHLESFQDPKYALRERIIRSSMVNFLSNLIKE